MNELLASALIRQAPYSGPRDVRSHEYPVATLREVLAGETATGDVRVTERRAARRAEIQSQHEIEHGRRNKSRCYYFRGREACHQ
jgi:hypothetical protein